MRKIFSVLLLVCLTGCGLKAADWARPNNRIFAHMPKDASPEYEQGWKEGCESGMTAHSNNLYQSFYAFRQDNKLLKNEVYYKAWQDASMYCRLYTYTLLREADMRRRTPNQPRFPITNQPVYGIFNFLGNWGQPFTNRR